MSLNELMDLYMRPLSANPNAFNVKQTLVDVVFASVEPIASFHAIFLKTLVSTTRGIIERMLLRERGNAGGGKKPSQAHQ